MNKQFRIKKINKLFRGSLVLLFLATSLIASSGNAFASNSVTNSLSNSDRVPSVTSIADSPDDSTGPITGSPNGVCQGSFCWYYSGAVENYVNAKGASATITQADPVVGSDDYHSLTELALKSQDGQQIVEFGWSVGIDQFGDTLPHMFVFHWVNGGATCYNACGYVPVGATNPVGAPVVGQTGNYEVKYAKAEWQIIYNGTEIGYFPESIWGGSFTKAFTVQIFGEVSAPAGVAPDSQMGNSILGNQPGSAQVSNYKLYGSPLKKTKLYPFLYGNPQSYEIGNVTRNSFSYGGPGGF